MTDYEKALAFWQSREIRTDAELAEVLSSYSISFAFHSGKIENDISPGTIPGKSLSMTASPPTPATCALSLSSATQRRRMSCFSALFRKDTRWMRP